ncbi:hypothetical protein TNIN_400741 [Trichonephila inaurata madagascariensis]|uniref:Uncharacterized protein n=1 Tax=Trichonephila inaurata madagascariensis TaxID=2747483 RepID=A0A8X6XVI8_9ARAC|nr:hypothetical protein TNIN_400741 [Trichonephila inaurata madagascariensis]
MSLLQNANKEITKSCNSFLQSDISRNHYSTLLECNRISHIEKRCCKQAPFKVPKSRSITEGTYLLTFGLCTKTRDSGFPTFSSVILIQFSLAFFTPFTVRSRLRFAQAKITYPGETCQKGVVRSNPPLFDCAHPLLQHLHRIPENRNAIHVIIKEMHLPIKRVFYIKSLVTFFEGIAQFKNLLRCSLIALSMIGQFVEVSSEAPLFCVSSEDALGALSENKL